MLEKTLAILDRTRPHKHGALSPESLHAESQWGRPDQKRKKQRRRKKDGSTGSFSGQSAGDPVPGGRGLSMGRGTTRERWVAETM